MDTLYNFPWWTWYLVTVNIVTFFAFGLDKARSRRTGARRTPEKTLWFLMMLGGTIGALMGMNYFRHKTKKLAFQAVVALILALQILLIFFFFQS